MLLEPPQAHFRCLFKLSLPSLIILDATIQEGVVAAAAFSRRSEAFARDVQTAPAELQSSPTTHGKALLQPLSSFCGNEWAHESVNE